MTGDQPTDGIDVRWNPDGWAQDPDGQQQQGRWEYWIDDDLALWWSDSDRRAFRNELDGDQP